MKNLKFKRKQGGYSFLELGLAFIIIATLAIAVFFGYRLLVGDADAVKLKDNILNINKAAVSTYKHDFSTITSTALIDSGKLTGDIVSGTDIVNAMGGIVSLSSQSVLGGSNNAYSQAHPLIDRNTCNTVVTSFSEITFQIDVGATTVKSDTITPTPATIISACNNTTNTVTFVFVK